MRRSLGNVVFGRRRTIVAITVAAACLLLGVGVWAFLTGTGQGSARATVASLAAPSPVTATATPGFTTVTVGWGTSTLSNGAGVDGYYVTRTDTGSGASSPACGSGPSSLLVTTSCNDTGVPDGTYTYAVTAVFRSWTATGSSGSVAISADTTPPTATISFPASGASYRNSSWTAGCNVSPFNATDTICGTAADPGSNGTGVAHVKVSVERGAGFYWNGVSFASGTEVELSASGTTTWSLPFPAGNFPADGSYTVRVYSTDVAGNTSSATSSTFGIDVTAPAVASAIGATTGTSPAGYVRQGGTYRVYANVTDAGSGVDTGSVTANVGNVTSGQSSVALTTSGCPCTVGGTTYTYRSAQLTADNPLAEGAKSYTVSAADQVGNSGSQSGTVTVDDTAPAVATVIGATTGTSPAGYVRQGGGYRLYANVTDSSSGVDTGSLTANVGNVTSGQSSVALTTSGCPCTVGGTSYAYRSAQLTADNPLAEGAKSYTVAAADQVANSASQSGSVTVDNTAPTIASVIGATTGTSPAGYVKQGGGYRLYANVTDSSSGVDTGSLTANVGNVTSGQTSVALSPSGCPCTVGGTTYTYRSAQLTADNPLAEGAKSYTVSAADQVGNSGSQSGTVTVDDTAPTIASVIGATTGTSPAGYVKQGGGYRLYANVTDSSSGVDTGSLTANVGNMTSGQTAVSLTSSGCPCTVGGTSYAYRSAQLTADNPLAEGAKSYTVAAADQVANSASQSGSVTVDNTAPTIVTVIGATTGTSPAGYVRQGGTYRVYANATDAGSGVDTGSVATNVGNVSAGQTSVALTTSGCPCTVGGTTYTYRSAQLTADNPLAEGAKSYTVAAADQVANSASQSGSVTVDNTAPTIATVIGATTGTSPAGYVKQGGGYRLYANVTDSSSGVDTGSITANVNTITSGQTSVALTTSGCPCTVGGTSYSYRSAQLMADSPLAEGAKSYTVAAADQVGNSGSQSGGVTVDNTAPAISTVIAGTTTSVAGSLQQGAAYRVYANVSDGSSGVDTGSLVANVGNVTSGQTSVALSSSGCPCTISGTSYTYRSAQLTADTPLSEGARSYTVTAADRVANSGSQSGTVTVDNTAPQPSSLTLANGQTPGRADKGDSVSIVYSEKINAASFCSSWSDNSGSSTLNGNGDVTVTITNNGSNDTLTVASATCTFHLGSVALGADYVSATSTYSGNGSNASSITWNPSSKTLTITLGSFASGARNSGVAAGTPSYTPSAALTDLAGNAISTSTFTSGSSSGF